MATLQELLDMVDNLEYDKLFTELHNLGLDRWFTLLKKEFLLNQMDVHFNERLKVQISSAFQNEKDKNTPLFTLKKAALGLGSFCLFTLLAFSANSFFNDNHKKLGTDSKSSGGVYSKQTDTLSLAKSTKETQAPVLLASYGEKLTPKVKSLPVQTHTKKTKIEKQNVSINSSGGTNDVCNQSDIGSFKTHLRLLIEAPEGKGFDPCFECIRANQYIDYDKAKFNDVCARVQAIIMYSPDKIDQARSMTALFIGEIKKN